MLRGWDFIELADEWGLYLPEYLDEEDRPSSSDWVRWHINYCCGIFTRTEKKMAKDIRKFCKLMLDDDCCFQCPIWEAFTKIDDDYTVVQMFTPLIGYAWT